MKQLFQFLVLVGASLAATPAHAQLPFKLLPDQIDATVRMEITRVKPGRWPCLPWRRDMMKRQGLTPLERRGRTRVVEIRSKVIIESPQPPGKK